MIFRNLRNGMYIQVMFVSLRYVEERGGPGGVFPPVEKSRPGRFLRGQDCHHVPVQHKLNCRERRLANSVIGGTCNEPMASVRERVAPRQILPLRSVQGVPIKEIGGVRMHCPELGTILEEQPKLGLHGGRRAPVPNLEERRSNQ